MLFKAPGSYCIWLILILLESTSLVQAQPSVTVPNAEGTQLIVADVQFAGNTTFSDEVLSLRVRTVPNRRFLGIPGFTWWLWLYRFGASGSVGERLGKALMTSGEAPAYLDGSVLAADVERLRLFYLQEGYRQVHVSAEVDTLRGAKKARVTFHIEPGTPTFVRHVQFDGIEALEPDQVRRLLMESLLEPERVEVGDPPGFYPQNQRYSEATLLEERRRILTFLRNAGFADVTRDSIRAIIYPERPDSFDVVMRIRPGERYLFGDVHFEVIGPETGIATRTDTVAALSPGGNVTVSISDERILDHSLLMRSLRFRPGDWYDQSRLLSTKRRLEGTGVFAFSDIIPLTPDSVQTGIYDAPLLPHRIDLRTRRRHQIRFETFMLQRTGVLAGGESELGTGIGLTYENVNLFGGGESFQVRTTGSIAADVVSDSTLAAQAEISASLTLPYLIRPLDGLESLLDLYDARTRISLSLLTAKRDELKLIIRGRGVARFRLEMQHGPTITSLVDVLDLSISNPDTLAGFKTTFLDNILGTGDSLIVTDPVQRARIIEDYTQPQVNSALRYTFRSARVNPLRRDRGYSYEGSFEVGSNLPYLLDRLVFSPDSVEGRIPGLPFFGGNRQNNRLAYRQYVRFLTDLRRYRPVGRDAVLATKFIAGFSHPTGQAEVVPFDRRFYSGGATSVRGWGLRELGPGRSDLMSLTDSTQSYTTNILGGDIKIEASLEWRNMLLRNLFAADWYGVSFVDAGNVWIGPRNPGSPEGRFKFSSFYRQVGVGTGLGVRTAWEYLILRLDLAFKVYDPARPSSGVLPDRLRRPLLHFGIGHTF